MAKGERPRCVDAGCAGIASRGRGLFCRAHWYAIPYDLRERVMWAADYGDEDELTAAIHAALDSLQS